MIKIGQQYRDNCDIIYTVSRVITYNNIHYYELNSYEDNVLWFKVYTENNILNMLHPIHKVENNRKPNWL